MIEFKTTQTVAKDSVTVYLPDEFKGKSVEITIKEVDETVEAKRRRLQAILLNGPIWTDEVYEDYLAGREHFSKWTEK